MNENAQRIEQLLSTTREKFWQTYLGRAYGLWLLLPADNQPHRPGWTRARKYRYKYLARSLGCGFATIKGGLRPCSRYEGSKIRGEPLTECCRLYHPVKWGHITTEGNQQCLHWNTGLMERLYNEGLLAIEEKGNYRKPRTHVLRLQVWTRLPLLTPKQVGTFSRDLQLEYRERLERIAGLTDFDLEAWALLTEETLVPQMAGYNQGRTLFDVYHPNPLRSSACSRM